MGYLKIDNLYKNQDILLFKECYAMEKIHGTSAHISYKYGNISFFSGGFPYDIFVSLFDKDKLLNSLREMFPYSGAIDDKENKGVIIYGEFYGGKIQGMSNTYGSDPKFIAFEVRINNLWLNVPSAESICNKLELEFVHYKKIPAILEVINEERDADSIQAIRNGRGIGHKREGIVLRPLEEVIKNGGNRIIAKHKRDELRETKTPRNLTDKLVRLTEIKDIVSEWVTEERLNHILTSGKVEPVIENLGEIIKLMLADIYYEGKGELEESNDLGKAIGRETALLFKRTWRLGR